MDLESRLKGKEEITILRIDTRDLAKAHKYLIEDGVVHFGSNADRFMTPMGAYRAFQKELPMFVIWCVDVVSRVEDSTCERGYRWDIIERLD